MNILIVDDEIASARAVGGFLESAFDFKTTICKSGKDALAKITETHFSVAIIDIQMPEISGIELLKQMRMLPQGESIIVVMMTGYANIETAIEAIRNGAYDYLRKPIDAMMISALFNRIQDDLGKETSYKLYGEYYTEKTEAVKSSEESLSTKQLINIPDHDLFGIFSRKMMKTVNLALMFYRDPSIPVLIEGETGTGKEGIARLVHHGLSRNAAPFITINCSSIPSGLFESELFGYEEGAFTGAKTSGNVGKLEMAHEGTLFLDEVGDMPLEVQPKLLRVLEEREMYRVGGTRKVELKVRIIAATNHDLRQDVESGLFRRDLFHRLNVGMIDITPLREQPEMIIPLSDLFLKRFSKNKKKSFISIDEDAEKILLDYPWKGNIRELKNYIERIVMLNDEESITADHLCGLTATPSKTTKKENKIISQKGIFLPADELNLKALEDQIIAQALVKFNGNKTRVAKYLGMSRTTLNSRIDKKGN